MKFLYKINRQYFKILSVLLVIVSITGYFVLQNILNNEMKDDIYEKEYAVIKEIKEQNNLPNIYPIIETKRVSKNKIEPKSYKKVFLSDEAEGEEEPYLEYTDTVKINNEYYLIKLRHSLLENKDLILAIAFPLLLLLISAFTILYFTSKKTNKILWKDFENNLEEIEHFSFKKMQVLSLKQTGIEEFDRLNSVISKLTGKLSKDYQNLKEFTENASHEIQTPLSIFLLSLEELLQQNLSEQAFKQVITSINAVKRLSALNKRLLLLTKIDNKQFQSDKIIKLNTLIETKIKEFQPLFEKQNLKVNFHNNELFELTLNEELAEILVNNMLSNAVKHNIKNGEITIRISRNELIFCNTGEKNSLTNETVFNRFTKENSHSNGLGLSIVKQICETCYLDIDYVKTDLHCFSIKKRDI